MEGYSPFRARRGVTLIEVLVVVGLIAVLAAVLVPVLSRARDQSRGVACRSNTAQLMKGLFLYVADHRVLPGTHSLFFFQGLFGAPWPRISGVTWDGARDRLVGFNITPAYTRPHHLDPEFVADVPGRGTLFRYLRKPGVYLCPADVPGEAEDSPLGGGGNGRLSYGLQAYVGYRSPESLASFTYAADAPDNPLPGGKERRSFKAGQRVVFPTSSFMMLFEEHPFTHMNTSFPEGNFNELDRIVTRHAGGGPAAGGGPQGRATIAFLDGHAEARAYPARTSGRELFTTYGHPYFWRESGPLDRTNIAAVIRRLPGPCPW